MWVKTPKNPEIQTDNITREKATDKLKPMKTDQNQFISGLLLVHVMDENTESIWI